MISDWRKCSFSKWFRCVVGDDEPKMQAYHFLTQQLYQSCDYFIYLVSYFTKKNTLTDTGFHSLCLIHTCTNAHCIIGPITTFTCKENLSLSYCVQITVEKSCESSGETFCGEAESGRVTETWELGSSLLWILCLDYCCTTLK